MWRAASVGLMKPRSHPASRLLSSTLAVSAVGLLALGCSSQTPTAPTRSTSARPAASVPAASPSHQQVVTFTSSMAPFKLPAAVSRPTVFAAGDGLLIVGGLTAADTTTRQDNCPYRCTMRQGLWWTAMTSSSAAGRPP
jgi:hypothetical protein